LSRTGVPGWETGTTAVSQPGQINVFVVVDPGPMVAVRGVATARVAQLAGSRQSAAAAPP